MVPVKFSASARSGLGKFCSASAQGGIGKFWKHVVDWSALDSILQNHLPLFATLT